MLEAGDVVEVLRRLDECDLRVGEVAEGVAEEVGRRDVVGVEDGDEVVAAAGQGVVQVAGLGVIVLLSGVVVHVHRLAQRLELFVPANGVDRNARVAVVALGLRAAVIKQVDVQLVLRIDQRLGGSERCGQKLRILVIGRDEDIDGRQVFVGGNFRFFPAQRIDHREEAHRQHQQAVHFGDVEQDAGDEVQGLVDARQRFGGAPESVAQRDRAGEDEGYETEAAVLRAGHAEKHHAESGETEHELSLEAHRQQQKGQTKQAGGNRQQFTAHHVPKSPS